MAVVGKSLVSHKEVFALYLSSILGTAPHLALWLPEPVKSMLRHYGDTWALWVVVGKSVLMACI